MSASVLPRMVRFASLAIFMALIAAGPSVLLGDPGLQLEGFGNVLDCSHDGNHAIGRGYKYDDDSRGNLLYWEYDEATGTGKTTAMPYDRLPREAADYYGRFAVDEALFPKDGVGLVYFTLDDGPYYNENPDDGAIWVWDVYRGTIESTAPGRRLRLVCCSDDGDIVYAEGVQGYEFDESNVQVREPDRHAYRLQRGSDGYAAIRIGEEIYGTGRYGYAVGATPCVCSGDGRIMYGTGYDLYGAMDDELGEILELYTFVYEVTPIGSRVKYVAYDDSSGRAALPLACSPDGQTAVFERSDSQGLAYSNPHLEMTDVPDTAEISGSGSGSRVTDNGVFYAEHLRGFLSSAIGLTKLPYPEGVREFESDYTDELEGDVDLCFAAAPNGMRFLYGGRDEDEDARPHFLRYSRATGQVQSLRDVFSQPRLTEVHAASRDLSRIYARDDWFDVLFFIEGRPVDTVPPVVESATVSVDGLTLTLVFSETVTDILPPTLNFTRGAVSATYESGDGTHAVKYALSRTIEKDETGTYDLAAGAVKDAAGNSNESASGPVVNRSKVVVDRTPPKVVSAKINAAGDTLTIVYSENVVHRRNPTLELSGGRVAARYESGTGSRAIAYDLSRDVRQGETGKYRLVEGAVVDAAGNRIEVASGPVQNGSTSRDDDDGDGDDDDDGGGGSHVRIKIDKRPNGSYANYYCDAAYQHASGILSDPNGYTSYGYYAFLNAYYSTLYRYKCGDRIRYDGSTHLTRAKALAIYKSRRRVQMLYAYYVQTYAYEEYKQTSSTSSLYAYLYAYYSYVYASRDLKAK